MTTNKDEPGLTTAQIPDAETNSSPNSSEPFQHSARLQGSSVALTLLIPCLISLTFGAASYLVVVSYEPIQWSVQAFLLVAAVLLSIVGSWLLAINSIRARKQELRLLDFNRMLKVFFEKNPEIMFVKNLDDSFALANEKFHEMVSDPSNILKQIEREDDLPSYVAANIHQQDLQVIQREEPMEFQSRYKRDGAILHLKTLRFPVFNDEGEMVAIGGISNDITDQVQSRRALIENERLLRTFIESAPDAVLICSADGEVTLVNQAAERVFGYEREQMLSQSLFSLIKDLSKELFQHSFSNEENTVTHTIGGNGRRADGDEFPVEFSLAPINTQDGSLMICILRDVSDKSFMESQLRQSQKMEAIGKLTGGMAHDFNNLLGIIIGNIALAKRRLERNDPLNKRLDTAMNAAQRGAELTKRMLAVARRQPLQPTPVFLNEVIDELAKILPQTLGADIEIELTLEADLPAILVDESAVESMLLNLAINARDAMPHGGKFTISTNTENKDAIEKALPSTVVSDTTYVHMALQDTGSGMNEETLNRAFEPFFTTKKKGKGTGLGLAMIYGFLKQSRGYIVLDSTLGVGTTIHIYLPAKANVDLKKSASVSKISVPFLAGKSHKILVVDDEVDLLEIARDYLTDLGLTVITADSGSEALDIITNDSSIELLLTDVVMPGMTGPALVKKVRAIREDVQILYASGYPSGSIEETSEIRLDAPLIHKPYTRDTLAESILSALANN